MKAGGVRQLIIPPSLGYGSSAYLGIPGNSILVFVVTLVSVQ
jgi:FKBP-type peptidyl-prolyl cis-trans isomerase